MWRRIKNFFIYHLTAGAVTLVGSLPAGWARRAGSAIGGIAHLLAARERAVARAQLLAALGPAASSRRARFLARGVFVELGRSAVELCRLRASPEKAPRVVLPEASRRALDEALSAGKGVVYVTGHIGNWELMAHALARQGYPISTVAKESYDPRFTEMIERFRSRAGVRSIYRGRPGASVAMLRAMKQNRVLGFLVDQDTSVPSAFVPFFGRPASTPTGAAALALRVGAPVVLGSIRRTADQSHIIDIAPCPVPGDARLATALFTQEIEARIRRHPAQWVWFHERWRTRPSEEAAA